MSTLTLRQSTEADIPLLVANGLDERGIRSPGFSAFLCYEKSKLVGLASGKMDVSARSAKDTSPRTCHLGIIITLITGRWDILLALTERHAQKGLDTGHTLAEVRVPTDGQCTNMGLATPVLVAQITSKVGIRWVGDGYDTVKLATAGWRTEPIVLADLLPLVKAQLDALSCKRVWA